MTLALIAAWLVLGSITATFFIRLPGFDWRTWDETMKNLYIWVVVATMLWPMYAVAILLALCDHIQGRKAAMRSDPQAFNSDVDNSSASSRR